MASAAGLLLFGAQPNRYLPQAGVSVAAYAGREKDLRRQGGGRPYAGRRCHSRFQRTEADGNALSQAGAKLLREQRVSPRGGVIERTLDFVRRKHLRGSVDRRGRAPAGALGVPAGGGAGGDRERHRPPGLHDYRQRRRALDLRRPHGDRFAGAIAQYGHCGEDARRLPGHARNELVKGGAAGLPVTSKATGLGVPRKIVRGMREAQRHRPGPGRGGRPIQGPASGRERAQATR